MIVRFAANDLQFLEIQIVRETSIPKNDPSN